MKLLIIGLVWPEPNSSAAGSRMLQIIEAFQSRSYNITFVSVASESQYAYDLSHMGIECVTIELNNSSFNAFVKELLPDIVIFDRFITEEQFGWRVAKECPDAFRILDTEDLHSLRRIRQQCVLKNTTFTLKEWQQAEITKREIASIYRCDLSLIISLFEMQLLQNTLEVNSELLYYLPFLVEKVSDVSSSKNFSERQHFITIGNFRHDPNYDSVLYVKDVIWPLIKNELPEAEMHVYGSYPSKKVMQLHNEKQRFFIKGRADNVNQIMSSSRVCLAPLRFGAGLKGKFFDAMCNGTPSITTSIGAEGINLNFGGFIEDDPKLIAKKAIELYTNEIIWRQKQENGYMLLADFDKSKLKSQFLRFIEDSLKSIEERRENNFIGSLLMHHSMQSTKYMSKWIESKSD